jgi:hypothetical protein
MANETKRVKPAQMEADRDSFAALQAIAGYAPASPIYRTAAITEVQNALAGAQTAEAQAEAALASARDTAVAREWEFHNLILGAKDQVIAQFGRDSNEVQAMGLKKTSERSAPTRGKTKSAPTK